LALLCALAVGGDAANSDVGFLALNVVVMDLSLAPYFYGSAYVPYTVFSTFRYYSAVFPGSKHRIPLPLGAAALL
jgi:urea transporter